MRMSYAMAQVSSDAVSTRYYSCKRCCARLFDDSLVLHESKPNSLPDGEPSPAGPGTVLSVEAALQLGKEKNADKAPLSRKEWLRENWVKESAVAGIGCTSVFTNAVPDWASGAEGNSGRITCPKCNAKVGSFVWSGASCSCGEWITPSFQFQLARVDRKGTVHAPIVQPSAGGS